MKIITPDEYEKYIREMPEDDLKREIMQDMKNDDIHFIEGSYDSLVGLFKNARVYLNCIKCATNEEASEFLKRLFNCFNIKNLNIDETLDRIKIDSVFHLKRISDWTISERKVITDNKEKINVKCYSAQVKKINNWGEESSPDNYDIVCHENQILWHTTNPDVFVEPDHYIMKNRKIYGLSCRHKYGVHYDGEEYNSKYISIYDNLDAIHNDICITVDLLDEIIDKYRNDDRFEERENVHLDDHFEKSFFCKGPVTFDFMPHEYIDFKVIGFVGNYIKIEITNLTYPQTGCILLDIENKEIIEEKKYQSRKISTEEEALDAIKPEIGFALSFIPVELRTAKVCLETVKKNPETLLFMPAEHRTEEMCLEAVKAHGKALEYVPDELKAPEVCHEAVKQNGWALRYVPTKLKTPKFCLEAIKTGDGALYCVPSELKTAEFCLEAVKLDAWSLNFVPCELKTVELCLEAMKQDVRTIAEVPEELRKEVLHRLTGGKYLLVQKKEHAKMSFEKEAISIEFTEIIGDMDIDINYDQKKRDEFLRKHGKKLLKQIPLRKIKGRNKYIEFRHETKILSQKEIDELLTATISLTPLKKVIDDLKWKLKWKIKKLREWKLIIKNTRKNIEYKISLNGIEWVDFNIKTETKVEGSALSKEELDLLFTAVDKGEVFSQEELDMILTPINKEDKK